MKSQTINSAYNQYGSNINKLSINQFNNLKKKKRKTITVTKLETPNSAQQEIQKKITNLQNEIQYLKQVLSPEQISNDMQFQTNRDGKTGSLFYSQTQNKAKNIIKLPSTDNVPTSRTKMKLKPTLNEYMNNKSPIVVQKKTLLLKQFQSEQKNTQQIPSQNKIMLPKIEQNGENNNNNNNKMVQILGTERRQKRTSFHTTNNQSKRQTPIQSNNNLAQKSHTPKSDPKIQNFSEKFKKQLFNNNIVQHQSINLSAQRSQQFYQNNKIQPSSQTFRKSTMSHTSKGETYYFRSKQQQKKSQNNSNNQLRSCHSFSQQISGNENNNRGILGNTQTISPRVKVLKQQPKKAIKTESDLEKTWIKNVYSSSISGRYSEIELKTNQDSLIEINRYQDRTNMSLYGVMDGHGDQGHRVSHFIKRHFPKIFDQELENYKDFRGNLQIKKSMINAFDQLNEELRKKQNIDTEYSGSTFNLIFFHNDKLYCGNVGDSRSLICKKYYQKQTIKNFDSLESDEEEMQVNWKARQISQDHKPELQTEARRILHAGGVIEKNRDKRGFGNGPLRVWVKNKDYPGLAMTRSIGDFNGEDAGIISEPEVYEIPIVQNDKIVVLASDGIWDMFTNQQVMDHLAPYYEKNDIKGGTTSLTKLALESWIKSDMNHIDDITCIVIFLGDDSQMFTNYQL